MNGPENPNLMAPPTDPMAEMCVLGSMILDNDAIGDALEILKPEMFAVPSHKTIFEAIVEMYSDRKPVDLVTLKAQLSWSGKEKLVRDNPKEIPLYLVNLVDQVPSAASILSYAQTVYEKACLRWLMEACTKVVHHICSDNQNLEDVRTQAEQALFTALSRSERPKIRTMSDILHDVFRGIQDIHDRKSRIIGLATGYYELDDMLSGFQKGQLYIVAGRPSMGKTSLAMNITENVAVREGKTVLFFSLEMSAAQLSQSFLCSHARVDSNLLRTGRVSEEEFQKLVLAAGAFHETKILIDDSADLSVLDVRTRARRMKASQGVDLIVVDYLQKMNARTNGRYAESRQVEISSISSGLKSMAKELDLPVLALAQLNRGPEAREDRRPMLSDLRESGAIEQDADAILLLYRDDYYNTDSEKKGIAEVILGKNRTGPTGTVELAFLKHFTRFENLSINPTNF